ncbi:MAG: DUF6786 family protein [Fimbriimonadaceae bacterium]
MRTTPFWTVALAVALVGCGGGNEATTTTSSSGAKSVAKPANYAQDVAFLKKHVEVIELGTGEGPGLVIVPEYQGRVMSSTFDVKAGKSIGFINHDVVARGEITKGMTAFGGEDRIWLGPEGGQFSIYFNDGEEQNGDNWQTPPVIDSETYDVATKSATEATFTKTATIKNSSGTEFKFTIERTVALLSASDARAGLGVEVPASVQTVAYESRNTLKNAGENEWTKDKGLLSVWILSMYKHSPTTNVIVPYNPGSGPVVKDDYFGKVPGDRLVDAGGYLVFKADGQYRSKIGLTPQRAKNVAGSWDSGNNVLTIVQYNKPSGVTDYVNSMWAAKQDDPYAGDVVNSYNDGPFAPGQKPMGPFYEIETSSPALALKPGGSYTHVHRTFHFTGDKASLQAIATAVLGVDLDAVAAALP